MDLKYSRFFVLNRNKPRPSIPQNVSNENVETCNFTPRRQISSHFICRWPVRDSCSHNLHGKACSDAAASAPQRVEKSRSQPGIIGRRPCCLGNSCECQRDFPPIETVQITFFSFFFCPKNSLTDGGNARGFFLPREEVQTFVVTLVS